MTHLAGSGLLHQQAETDIEGIPLRRVFVNVSLTERFKVCVDESELVEMSMHVKPVFQQAIIY